MSNTSQTIGGQLQDIFNEAFNIELNHALKDQKSSLLKEIREKVENSWTLVEKDSQGNAVYYLSRDDALELLKNMEEEESEDECVHGAKPGECFICGESI